AAAFILAEFATAGMATFMLAAGGIAVSAGNAALSIKDYMTKKNLEEGSSGNKELDIIANEQDKAALFAEVLDSIFIFLDGSVVYAGGLSKGARASAKLLEVAEEGAAKGAVKAVAEAVAHGGPAAVSAIERSVAEVGVKATMNATGKTAEQ